MQIKTLAAAILGASTLTACVIVDGYDEDDGPGRSFHVETQFGLEALKAVSITKNDVPVRMASNGCTTKETVEANVDQDGRNTYEIAIERLEEDRCRALLQDGTELTWSYEELRIPAGALVRVINKVES